MSREEQEAIAPSFPHCLPPSAIAACIRVADWLASKKINIPRLHPRHLFILAVTLHEFASERCLPRRDSWLVWTRRMRIHSRFPSLYLRISTWPPSFFSCLPPSPQLCLHPSSFSWIHCSLHHRLQPPRVLAGALSDAASCRATGHIRSHCLGSGRLLLPPSPSQCEGGDGAGS